MTPPDTNPWARWGWVFAAIWLVFLAYPVLEVLQTDHPLPVQALGISLIAAFAVVYILGFSVWEDRPWLTFGLMVALACGTIPIIGFETIGMTPYLGVYAALQLPPPWWPRVTALIAALPLISLLSDGGLPAFFFLMVWPIIVAMVLVRIFVQAERRADEARAELALVAERERVARDVHDVLGHHSRR